MLFKVVLCFFNINVKKIVEMSLKLIKRDIFDFDTKKPLNS